MPRTATGAPAASRPAYPPEDAFRLALRFTGAPHRRRGSRPSGFDGSGFVRFVLREFGVLVPHSARGILGAGEEIGERQACPGDLVVARYAGSLAPRVGFYSGTDAHGRIWILGAGPARVEVSVLKRRPLGRSVTLLRIPA